MVQWLIANGADVNAKDYGKRSVLSYAACNGNLELVKYLADQGADVSFNYFGYGILGSIRDLSKFSKSKECLDIMRFCVERGADPKNLNRKSEKKNEILEFCSEQGNLKAVEWLIEQNVSYDLDDVLLNAGYSGNFELVQWLVEQGADVNAKNDFDYTVLYVAVESGNLEMVQWLAEQGAEGINEPDILIPAVDSGNIELVKHLAMQRLDLSKANNVLSTAARHAASCGNLEIIKWLVTQGLDVTRVDGILHLAIESNNLKLVQWLVDQKVDVNSVYKGDTVMAYIYFSHNRNLMNYLIDYAGVDVNTSINESEYCTALERAASFGDFELVQYLVEHGANVNPNMGKAIFPFWYVLSDNGGDPEIVKYLKQRDNTLTLYSGFLAIIVFIVCSVILFFVLRQKTVY